MSELLFSKSCQFCSKPFYGPVQYCPFCSKRQEADYQPQKPPPTPQQDTKPNFQQSQDPPPDQYKDSESANQQPQKSPTLPPQDPAPIYPSPPKLSPTFPVIHTPPKPKSILGKILLLIFVFVIVGGGGYYFLHNEKIPPDGPGDETNQGPAKSPTTELPVAPTSLSDPKKEIARILATETVSQGVVFSKAVNRVPKFEITLEAAKKLTNISPRYQEQEKKAETALLAAKDNRDKSLMAYMGKLLELTRHSQENIAYGIDIVRNSNLATREQKVADLLDQHVKIIKEKSNVEPEKILGDFSEQFKDFVD